MIQREGGLFCDRGSIQEMDDADKKLENVLKSIYYRIGRQFKGLYLKLAVTKNLLQAVQPV